MADGDDIIGYTVAYDREDLAFPVYVVATVAVGLLSAAMIFAMPALAIAALVPAAYTYYNLPLLEAGRPRLGAGEYGLFIEGLGLVPWRAISTIETEVTDFRGTPSRTLAVSLRQSVGKVLLVDWRQRPWLRRPMRLPWHMKSGTEIRIPLDIMDKPPSEIASTLNRMWKFHRGR